MASDYYCLLDKHHGSDPYFRTDGEYAPKRKMVRVRSIWPKANQRANRAVDDLHQCTHNRPVAPDLNRVYPDAVEIGRGELSLTMAVGFTVFGLLMAGLCLAIALLFAVIIGSVGALVMLLLAWVCFRMAIWGPRDAPVLFNRKTREVHAIDFIAPHFFKVWKLHARTWITSFDWDRVKVRSYVYLASGGAAATTRSSLYLLWDSPDHPRKLEDYARLGSEGGWVDDPLWAQWEYVRRYMEEDGPMVPEGSYDGRNYNVRPNMFPSEVIEAAGGKAYSWEQLANLIDQQYRAAESKTDRQAATNA